MTNLAIECSGTAGSVALFDDRTPIAYADLDTSVGSVRTMADAIETILRGRAAPTFVSVTSGPGSFTGLRVGLTTAKMLGVAWGIPIVPVDTLHAISLRAFRAIPHVALGDSFVAVINAFRGQVFASVVSFAESEQMTVLAESCVLDAATWRSNPVASLGDGRLLFRSERPSWITGPGLRSYPVSSEQPECLLVDESLWDPTAAEVAALGLVGFESGRATSADKLEPNYIRASAAEEKRKQTIGQQDQA